MPMQPGGFASPNLNTGAVLALLNAMQNANARRDMLASGALGQGLQSAGSAFHGAQQREAQRQHGEEAQARSQTFRGTENALDRQQRERIAAESSEERARAAKQNRDLQLFLAETGAKRRAEQGDAERGIEREAMAQKQEELRAKADEKKQQALFKEVTRIEGVIGKTQDDMFKAMDSLDPTKNTTKGLQKRLRSLYERWSDLTGQVHPDLADMMQQESQPRPQPAPAEGDVAGAKLQASVSEVSNKKLFAPAMKKVAGQKEKSRLVRYLGPKRLAALNGIPDNGTRMPGTSGLIQAAVSTATARPDLSTDDIVKALTDSLEDPDFIAAIWPEFDSFFNSKLSPRTNRSKDPKAKARSWLRLKSATPEMIRAAVMIARDEDE